MRISPTLSVYFGRQFLLSFLMLFGMFLLLIFMIDTVELLRRTASKPNVDFFAVVQMALMKLPHMGQKTFPFAILFGAMLSFWRLTRSHELVISRSAGVSAWQFMLPPLLIAFMLGIFQVAAINPLASTTLTVYERLEALHLKGKTNYLAISSAGLWLRQANKDGQSIIHSGQITQYRNDVLLTNVSIIMYEGQDRFKSRIDAKSAQLEDGFWHLNDASIYVPEEPPKFEKDFWLETDLTLGKIQDNFAPPETMSFWDLPGFISTLEDSGFSAVRHRLYLHTLLAAPFLLCAMVLIAATFTLRISQRGSAGFVIFGGLMTGFLLFFFSDVVFALGLSDSIPIILAAWAPSGIATLLGLSMLFHLEDG